MTTRANLSHLNHSRTVLLISVIFMPYFESRILTALFGIAFQATCPNRWEDNDVCECQSSQRLVNSARACEAPTTVKKSP
jgi:hypothetical protein